MWHGGIWGLVITLVNWLIIDNLFCGIGEML